MSEKKATLNLIVFVFTPIIFVTKGKVSQVEHLSTQACSTVSLTNYRQAEEQNNNNYNNNNIEEKTKGVFLLDASKLANHMVIDGQVFNFNHQITIIKEVFKC